MSENEYEIVKTLCPECGTQFLPFGYEKVSIELLRKQVFTHVKCPKCGFKFQVWFDEQIKREYIRKTLGLESKEREIEEKIKTINQLMNTFLGLDSKASIEDAKERAKEIGETWKTLIEMKDFLNKKKDEWFPK